MSGYPIRPGRPRERAPSSRTRPATAVKSPAPERMHTIIPERIHEKFPDVKLVAILRDPVQRCVSAYRMRALDARETRPFDLAIADLLSPPALERSRRGRGPGLVALGEYGRILAGYYEVFPKEQIFVAFTTDLETKPREVMRGLFDFLDVDRTFVPSNLGNRYMQAAASRRIGWLQSPSDLQKRLIRQPGVRSLWRMLPPGMQRRVELRLREVNYRFDQWNRRAPNPLEASNESLVRLRAHYEPDRALLEQLIGRPVPWGGDRQMGESRA
jgi:Sulfotransferase domain